MRRLAILFLLSAITVLALRPGHPLRAQSPGPLPADLYFTTSKSVLESSTWQESKYNTLAYVDAETLEVAPFYHDESVRQVRAISWSPDGTLLAILRKASTSDMQEYDLCLLKSTGIFLRCFEDKPSQFIISMDNYWVTWSPDSQKLYFTSETTTGDDSGIRRLIEADVITGRRLRVIFEYPYHSTEVRSDFAWSSDLNSIVVGVDQRVDDRVLSNVPTFIVNRTTGKQTDLTSIVPDHSRLTYVCPQVSPFGTYVAVHALYVPDGYGPDSSLYALHQSVLTIIYNYELGTQIILSELEDKEPIYAGCPIWQSDGQGFFFFAQNLRTAAQSIYRYSLVDQKLSLEFQVSQSETSYALLSEFFTVPPENTHFAFSIPWGVWPIIAVRYPNGIIQIFAEPYPFALYPLWGPEDQP